jgi:outer membrane immunogenic protein
MDQVKVSDPCNPIFAGGGCLVGGTGNYNGVNPAVIDMNTSFVGGGRVGYNWQPTPWTLLGIENEIGYLHLKGTANMNPFGGVAGDTNAFAKIGNWYDALTARIGMTDGHAMFFIRGGGVWTKEQTGVIDTNPAGSTINTTTSKTLTGWAAGGGVEYGIDMHWSVRADYLVLGIPTSFVVNCGTAFLGGVAPIPGSFCSGTRNNNIQTITLGLNYRFH